MADQEAFALRNRIIGVLLQDARVRANRTKRECATALGVTARTITAYEEGRKSISLPELELLALFLDVPVRHFWSQEAGLLSAQELPEAEDVLELRNRIVGALLRQARLEADKTQSELARLAGIPRSRLASYEYGERPIALVELEALAGVLDRPMDYFLDEGSGAAEKGQSLREMNQAFLDLPKELREFVTRPINRSYLELAMRLAEMPAGALRGIAEGLLEITY